ncbi:MAG TPA: AarF/ABC1/UbiB kinase family protein [Syntrophales bacterium]|nr:AarF/ABC1/UbiB kinase family protein [Syntrophales bacterium]
MHIRKIGIVSRTYRNIVRYRQILTVLFKYGFESLIDRLHLGQYLDIGIRLISRKPRERFDVLSRYERLRMAFEELGPTFIKMGQILSTRPDLIPVEFIRELEKLQDNVPPFPFSQVKEIVERELHASLTDTFLHFHESPLAAASIAQVHRAQLKTGEEVIVKVQRPGMRKIIDVDLEILFHLASLAEKYIEELEIYRPTKIVEEFAFTLEKEINFNVEASYVERFSRQFLGNKNVYVPGIFRHMTTEHVLTMEYVEGIKVSDITALDQKGFDRKIIASRGADLMLEQIFMNGFFHADPHPGNVCVLPGNVICYLDFGMMGHVDQQARHNFANILYGYVLRDESKIAAATLKIVEWEDEPDRHALERDIASFMELHLYKPLKEIRIGYLLQEFLGLFIRHRLRLPPDIFLMVKALTEIEGVGLLMDPDFDMAERVEPFIKRLQMEKMQPKRLLGDFIESGSALVQLLKSIPEDMHDILTQVKQGKSRIRFEHRGLENFIFEMDRSSNRIAFSLIIASIIIGSSLIIMTNLGPHLFGFSMLGLVGYTIAGVLGVWLLISIFRSGKL